ncbi:low molecular weight phosphotyrosine protein phosphatase [Caballeronia sp. Lep1P3]|uniref:arsenate reductase/protein-tyrosine-phosphatase family protein n=1 Tax=Caballeronia sp. Lep1P3 TaxID=2878150 RepID=UPI00351D20A4
MAAALLAQCVGPEVMVSSAGTAALDGRPADSLAVDLMRQCGVDLSAHIARTVNLRLMRESELVLTMTQAQRDSLLSRYPFARGRVYRLRPGAASDVIDPFRQDRACFNASLEHIREGVSHWTRRLRGPLATAPAAA